MYIHIYIYIHRYKFIYVYSYIYMSVYLYKKRERESERDRETQYSTGATLWLPTADLPMPVNTQLVLPLELPEIVVPGWQPVPKLARNC